MNIIETEWDWNGGLSNRSRTDYIALHHAECTRCTAAQVDEWHKANGWSGIGYHFFVRKDGTIYRGRPIWAMGAHVLGKNDRAIGICAEGAYMTETMPEAQKTAIAELLDYLKINFYPNAEIVGHGEIGESDCPGKNFPLDELKNYKDILNSREELSLTQYEELKELIKGLQTQIGAAVNIADIAAEGVAQIKHKMIYNYIDDNMPEWAREGVQWCVDRGIVKGDDNGLNLDDKDLRWCTMLMRAVEAK